MGLGLGLGLKLGGFSGGGVTAFAYEAEAQTFFTAAAAAGVEPTAQRKRTYNRFIKRLKTKGVWSKLNQIYLLAGATDEITRINIKNPNTNDLSKVGTPTFSANNGWSATAGVSTDYLNTGVPLNTISQNDHSIGCYSNTASSVAANDIGATSTTGLSISTKSSTNRFVARSFSGSVTVGATTDIDGSGFYAISRSSSTEFNTNKYGYNWGAPATASSAIVATTTPITILLSNGSGVGATGRQLSFAFIGSSLTETEIRNLYGAFDEYFEAVKYGEIYEEEVAIGTTNITADVIIYGATSLAITAAYEVARQGKTVAICGGWRDRRLGGMSTSGLGSVDFDNQAGLGGLTRWILTKINSLYVRADNTFTFESKFFQRACRFLMDTSLNGGLSIPVYYTRGVSSVSKTGTNITSIRTGDGRTFTGSMFIDCSYEGDLAVSSGVGMVKGREAAGSGQESLNGFRGVITTAAGNNHQFKSAGVPVNIDPYNTVGVSASGLLNGLSRTFGVSTPALGTADDEIQAYNFRLAFVDFVGARFIPLPSTPPSGYNILDWEALGRFFAAYPSTSFYDIFLVTSLASTNTKDINSKGGWSTDFWGGNKTYPSATYSEREVIWKNHWNRILGLFYYLQYESDARIPAAVRTTALSFGFDATHYTDGIHENDSVFTTPQLYVREAWRMNSDIIWDGNDISATDGTTPRSTKTISVASYAMDSHSTEALADPNSGSPRIWASGNFEYQLLGDKLAPIPYDIIIPKAAECTNLFVTFAVSSTHVAFGSIRMELTSMQMSQSAGLAACLAIDSVSSVQSVDYPTLRTELLASPTLAGEVAPVLPQLN